MTTIQIIVAAVIYLLVLSASVYYGYRKWKSGANIHRYNRRQLNKRLPYQLTPRRK